MSRSMFEEGTLSLLFGWQGTGKTDISWLLDLYGVLNGKHILSNKKLKKYAWFPNIEITTDVQFINHFLKLRKNIVVGLDEANLFQSSKRSQSKQNTLLESFISIIRHFRASIYFIIQRKANYLPYLRENAYWEIRKVSKKEMKLINQRGKEGFYYNYPSAKRFGINYDTYSFSNFEFKLELEKLLQDCTDKKYYSKQVKELKKIARNDFKGYWIDERYS